MKKYVALSMAALALAACGDGPTTPRASTATGAPSLNHVSAPSGGAVVSSVDQEANTARLTWGMATKEIEVCAPSTTQTVWKKVQGTWQWVTEVVPGACELTRPEVDLYSIRIARKNDDGTYTDLTSLDATVLESADPARTHVTPELASGIYRYSVTGVDAQDNNEGHRKWAASVDFQIDAEQETPPEDSRPTPTFTFSMVALTYGQHLDLAARAVYGASDTEATPVRFRLLDDAGCTLGAHETHSSLEGTAAGRMCRVEAYVEATPSYRAASAIQAVVVAKAELTVTADDMSHTYDGTAFTEFTSTFAGWQRGDGASVVTGDVAYAGDAVTATDVRAGGFTITPIVSGLAAANYFFTPIDGTLTIDPRPIAVSASSPAQIAYGSATPTFGYSLVGSFVGQDEAAFAATVGYLLNGAAVPAGFLGVGSHTITPTWTYTNANYAITLGSPATLRVVYGLDGGIRQPINPDNTSLFSRGRSVPVKFGMLNDGAPNFPNGFSTAGWKVVQVPLSCTSVSASVAETETEALSTSAAGFRYDASADQYIFNADFSGKAVGSCWRVRVELNDGSTLTSATFKLQK